MPFPHTDHSTHSSVIVEAASGGVFQAMGRGIVDQDARCIHAKLERHLIEQDTQRET